MSVPSRGVGIGKIVAIPQLGGLHHRYERIAAGNFCPDRLLAKDRRNASTVMVSILTNAAAWVNQVDV
jgi:hypothetical protein